MYTGNSAVGVSGIIPPAALHCIDPLKLVGVLDILDSVGFDSVDVWGADDFGVCLEKYGSDPWDRLRTIRKAVKKTRLRLLLGGQSLLGCGVYADDVVDYFVERAVDNGIDVIRAYDALNDPRNLESVAAGRFGIEFEGAIVYAESPAHSVSFFAGYASLLEQMGANAICILDPEHLLGADTAAALFAAVQKSVSIPVRASLLSDSGLHAELDAKIDAFDCLITSEIPYKAIKAAGAHVSERKISELSRLLRKSVDVNAKKDSEYIVEVWRVRDDAGHPPMIPPVSYVITAQAEANLRCGERYKTVLPEFKALVRGMYGRAPMPVAEDILSRVVKNAPVLLKRPADMLAPELDRLHVSVYRYLEQPEDVLTYAIAGDYAVDFFERRLALKYGIDASHADAKHGIHIV